MNYRRERNTMQSSEMMVSVYCLAYNHEKYIRSALDGFVNQKTDISYEVFVHDDASTDGTAAIIREYAEKYPHIIKPILQTQNQYSQGIKIMRTHILPRMTGKYIAICEGDDFWCDPEKLQMQVDFLESHPDHSACVHNTLRKDMTDGSEHLLFGEDAYTVTPEKAISRGSAAYQTSSLMYRRELALDPPSFMSSVKGIGDFPLAIYLSLKGKIHYIPKVMSVYRANVNGSWTKRVEADPEKLAKVNESILSMLQMADAYSDGKYHEAFAKSQARCEYKILKGTGQFRKARKHPCFRDAGMKEKCMITALACFPWMRNLKRKLRRK